MKPRKPKKVSIQDNVQKLIGFMRDFNASSEALAVHEDRLHANVDSFFEFVDSLPDVQSLEIYRRLRFGVASSTCPVMIARGYTNFMQGLIDWAGHYTEWEGSL